MKTPDLAAFGGLLKKAKLRLLKMHHESGIGHIGGNLSSLDAMLFLHTQTMEKDDLFILSKGHSAGALYVTLWAAGQLADDDLAQFHKDNTSLPGHPVGGWHPGIRFSTGSLGHGLGLSAGVGMARRLQKNNAPVYCLTSDGEWNEGSNWEAALFIAHHNLHRVTILIDRNDLQGFGRTGEVANMEPFGDKFRAFGFDVLCIDGHDPRELQGALAQQHGLPKVIIMRTVKGHGVSFMENKMEWHYLPMSKEQYQQAVDEVERA